MYLFLFVICKYNDYFLSGTKYSLSCAKLHIKMKKSTKKNLLIALAIGAAYIFISFITDGKLGTEKILEALVFVILLIAANHFMSRVKPREDEQPMPTLLPDEIMKKEFVASCYCADKWVAGTLFLTNQRLCFIARYLKEEPLRFYILRLQIEEIKPETASELLIREKDGKEHLFSVDFPTVVAEYLESD